MPTLSLRLASREEATHVRGQSMDHEHENKPVVMTVVKVGGHDHSNHRRHDVKDVLVGRSRKEGARGT